MEQKCLGFIFLKCFLNRLHCHFLFIRRESFSVLTNFLSYGSRYTSTCSGEKENFSYNVFNVPLVVLSSFNNNRSSTGTSCSIKKSIIAACLWACEDKAFFASLSSSKDGGMT